MRFCHPLKTPWAIVNTHICCSVNEKQFASFIEHALLAGNQSVAPVESKSLLLAWSLKYNQLWDNVLSFTWHQSPVVRFPFTIFQSSFLQSCWNQICSEIWSFSRSAVASATKHPHPPLFAIPDCQRRVPFRGLLPEDTVLHSTLISTEGLQQAQETVSPCHLGNLLWKQVSNQYLYSSRNKPVHSIDMEGCFDHLVALLAAREREKLQFLNLPTAFWWKMTCAAGYFWALLACGLLLAARNTSGPTNQLGGECMCACKAVRINTEQSYREIEVIWLRTQAQGKFLLPIKCSGCQ